LASIGEGISVSELSGFISVSELSGLISGWVLCDAPEFIFKYLMLIGGGISVLEFFGVNLGWSRMVDMASPMDMVGMVSLPSESGGISLVGMGSFSISLVGMGSSSGSGGTLEADLGSGSVSKSASTRRADLSGSRTAGMISSPLLKYVGRRESLGGLSILIALGRGE